MLKATFKGLLAHKLRLGLTVLAVVLGVAFIAGTLVLTDTISSTFDNLFEDAAKGVDVVVRSTSGFQTHPSPGRNPVDGSLLATVRAVPGVRAAAGAVQGIAQLVDKQGKAINAGPGTPLGASWSAEPQGSITVRTGRPPAASTEVMIDAATARARGFKVGDAIKVVTAGSAGEFTISGLAGFGEADGPAGGTLAVFDLATAQALFGRVGKLDGIEIAAAPGTRLEQLVPLIAQSLPQGTEAVSSAVVANEQSEAIKVPLRFFNTALLIFAGISLLVGAFIIFNTFSITVAQRTGEFALLRALGASGGQVTLAVLFESLLVGVIASAAGIAAGVGIAVGLRAVLKVFGVDVPSSGLVLAPRSALVAAGVGIVVTLGAALGPARRASGISPMAALRASVPRAGGFSRRRTAAGLVMLALGAGIGAAGLFVSLKDPVRLVGAGAVLILLGVATLAPLITVPLARLIGGPVARTKGLSGKLARQNAVRNPRRTAATASALMIGLALVAFVSIMGASLKESTNKVVDESLKADFTVSSAALGPPIISPAVSEEIARLDQVQAVAPIRLAQFRRSDGRKFFVVGSVPGALAQVADLKVLQGDLQALKAGEVWLYRQAAQDLGLKAGDTFVMEFPASGKQALKVAGIFDNKSGLGTDYLIALATYDANVPERADAQVLIKLKPRVSIAAARSALGGVAAKFPGIQIDDQLQSKQRSARQVNQLLGLVSALLGLALIIAVLGITNTLALSVFERTRELGLLRAVGMSRGQVRSMIRWEAVIISAIGAVLGLAVGLLLGWAIVTSLKEQGLSELAVPVLQLLGYLVAAGLAGVLAAVPPARRAARLNVLAAISAE